MSQAMPALGVGAFAFTAREPVRRKYLQVFALDRVWKRPRRTSAMLAVALCTVAVILRLSMPPLPE